MNKFKVVTIVGTRPEIIRLSSTIKKLDKHHDHYLIHTGQNYDYELNEVFFQDLGLKAPFKYLGCADKSALSTIANVLREVEKTLDDIKPNAVLVLGDTNSCLSILAAKYKRIPTFHMEAGNRCFDMRVPEEINRRLVDHVADINLTYSTIARDYLINEGLPPDLVIKVGSPMKEALHDNMEKIKKSTILKTLDLKKGKFFLVSCHRQENVEIPKQFKKISKILNKLAEEYELPVIVSTHPRTKNKIEGTKFKFSSKISFLKPLGFTDYINLQLSAKVVLSDSGTINEESSILGFPAINFREAHERPEAMEESATIMTGLSEDRVLQAVNLYQENKSKHKIVADYDVDNVSEKVCKLILSYTDYVNRVVWKQY